MTTEYDESCNAYGPIPAEEDQYKPDTTAKGRWKAVMARMTHDRHSRNVEPTFVGLDDEGMAMYHLPFTL